MKTQAQLLGSASSLEGINKIVNEYFFSDKSLIEKEPDKEWQIKRKDGSAYSDLRVVYKKNRYRFELINFK